MVEQKKKSAIASKWASEIDSKFGGNLSAAAQAMHDRHPEAWSSFDACRSALRARHKSFATPPDEDTGAEAKTEYEEGPDGASFKFNGKLDRPMTVEEMLDVHAVDTETWMVDRVKVTSWGVTSKIRDYDERDGKVVQVGEHLEAGKNYYISVGLKRRDEDLASVLGDACDRLVERLAQKRPAYKKRSSTKPDASSRMLELSIFDLHVSKAARDEETGLGDWNTKIARSVCLEAAEELLGFFPSVGRILLPIGNDWFQADTIENTTTAGTPVDSDCSWAQSLDAGVDLAIDLVEMCRSFAPTDVVTIAGNHDTQRVQFLGRVLESHFRGDEGVTVDRRAMSQKCYVWGDVMLGFMHGKDEKPKDMPSILPMRWPKEWAATRHREAHIGHHHRCKNSAFYIDEGMEEHMVRTRIIPSLCSADLWHSQRNFANIRAAEAYLWDKKKLYLGHTSYTLPA